MTQVAVGAGLGTREVRYGREYAELKRRVVEEGLLEKRSGHYVAAGTLALAVLVVAVWLVPVVEVSWVQVLGVVLLAEAKVQLAFLAHDVGHRAVTSRRRLEDILGLLLGNLVLGVSRTWWIDKHNAHHGHPNEIGADPDIEFPFVAFDEVRAQQKQGLQRWVVRHQAFLLFPLMALIGLWGWYRHSLRTVLGPGVRYPWAERFLLAAHFLWFYGWLGLAIGGWAALAYLVLHHAVIGLHLGAVFAPNHKGMPVLEPGHGLDFLRRQVLTSRNVRPSWLTDAAYGGLNYQIEHHLFPSMPRSALRRARAIVRSFCQQHGLTYHETGTWQSLREVLQHMHAVGAPLRRRPTKRQGVAPTAGLAARALVVVTTIELVVAVYLGIRLTFLTELAMRTWMWDMPLFGTRYLGTIYLTAVAPVALLLAWRRRPFVRFLSAVILVFGGTLLVVSLIYLARFRVHTWGTWLWFALYVLMPVHALYQLWTDRRAQAGRSDGAPRPAWERRLLLAVAAVLGAYGVALLLLPGPATSFWPWMLDDFGARVYSAPFLACATGAALLRRGGTAQARLTLGLTLTLLGILPIAGVVSLDLAVHRLDWTPLGARLWLVAFGLLGLAGLVILRSALQGMRVMRVGHVAVAAARIYLWLLALSLLLQGLVALLLSWIGPSPEVRDLAAALHRAHLLTDPRHSLLHVAWAGPMVVLLSVTARQAAVGLVSGLNLSFGLFYTALALYVASAGSPLGLEITAAQNTFHFLAGPSALAFGIASWVAPRRDRY